MIIVGDLKYELYPQNGLSRYMPSHRELKRERRSCKTKQIQKFERPYYLKHLLVTAKSGFRSLP